MENKINSSEEKLSARKFNKPFLVILAVVIFLVGLVVSMQLIQNTQDTRSGGIPTQEIQKPDSGQEPTEDQINKGTPILIDDSELEPPTIKPQNVKGEATTSDLNSGEVLGLADKPVVSIDNPINGSTVPKYAAVQIVASAKHDSGIQSIVISINGIVIKTCTNASFCYVWRGFAQSPAGSVFVIKAVAVPKNNPSNANTAMISVCKEGGTSCSGRTPTNTPVPSVPYETPTITSPPGQADQTPPIVTINSPASGAVITQSSALIHASASDASGINNMKIYIDSSLRTACPSPICQYTYPIGTVTPGTHTIRVTATDKAAPVANTSSRTITVIYQPSATPSITGRVTPFPTPTIPRVTVTPPTPGYPTITGSGSFVSSIKAAIDQIRAKSSTNYQALTQYVRSIIESRNVAYVSSYSIGVSTISALSSRAWAASTIVHETWHIKNFYEGRPWYGCVGEANSLRKQAEYLRLVGDSGTAQYVLDLIGHWPPGADCSFCITTTCRPGSIN